jgi:hypothetical protein
MPDSENNYGFPEPARPIHDLPEHDISLAEEARLRGAVADLKTEPVSIEELSGQPSLQSELSSVLNRYSAENGSGTPDFILAEYLLGCLKSYNNAITRRAAWNGFKVDRYGHEVPDGD